MTQQVDNKNPQKTILDPKREFRLALFVYAAVFLFFIILWSVSAFIPFFNYIKGNLIPATFLFVPIYVLFKKKENLDDYGLKAEPIQKGLAYFFALSLVVFPLFSAGFFLYYRWICKMTREGMVSISLYRRICPSLKPAAIQYLRLDRSLLEKVVVQVLAVGLPEEFFFRGYLQTKVEGYWPIKRRFLGGSIGKANFFTSFLFAIGHVFEYLNPLRIAVFFPSLLFGWLKSATGSILASVLFHAMSNIISDLLHRSFLAL